MSNSSGHYFIRRRSDWSLCGSKDRCDTFSFKNSYWKIMKSGVNDRYPDRIVSVRIHETFLHTNVSSIAYLIWSLVIFYELSYASLILLGRSNNYDGLGSIVFIVFLTWLPQNLPILIIWLAALINYYAPSSYLDCCVAYCTKNSDDIVCV